MTESASAERPAPAMTPQQSKLTSGSGFEVYKELAVGRESSLVQWIFYEVLTLTISGLPGILGFGLRSLLYPLMLKQVGKRPAIGRSVVVRNPAKIILGDKVMVDDFAVLDVRGSGLITLGDRVSLGRFSTVAAKGGPIELKSGVNIGSYCRIATQSKIEIGESVLVGAYSYIGPGNHQLGDENTPLIERPMELKGGVKIGAHAWIGAHVTILDGVTIGERAIIGAHSLVLEDVPPGATAVGVPAKVIRA